MKTNGNEPRPVKPPLPPSCGGLMVMLGIIFGGIGGYLVVWELQNPQPADTYAHGLATTIGGLFILCGLSLVGGAILFTAERRPRWLGVLVIAVGTLSALLLAQVMFNPLGLLT